MTNSFCDSSLAAEELGGVYPGHELSQLEASGGGLLTTVTV